MGVGGKSIEDPKRPIVLCRTIGNPGRKLSPASKSDEGNGGGPIACSGRRVVSLRNFVHLRRTSRNRKGERGRWRMSRVKAANPSLTAGALIRWQHPERGLIQPSAFIPAAEETGLITVIGAWLLRTSCRQTKAWHDAGLPRLRMSVNISPRQLRHPYLFAIVGESLLESGLDSALLELELTEGALVEGVESSIQALCQLRALGVQIALDDFGTGCAFVAHLSHFPISRLKIDGAFIREISRSNPESPLAAGLIAFAHGLGLGVTFERVETIEQLAFLRKNKCEEMQGYLVSPALEPGAFAGFVKAWRNAPVPRRSRFGPGRAKQATGEYSEDDSVERLGGAAG